MWHNVYVKVVGVNVIILLTLESLDERQIKRLLLLHKSQESKVKCNYIEALKVVNGME